MKQNIKELIYKKGLKQIAFAKAIGINHSQLNRYINGWEPIPKKYESKICKELGISLPEFEKLKHQ